MTVDESINLLLLADAATEDVGWIYQIEDANYLITSSKGVVKTLLIRANMAA